MSSNFNKEQFAHVLKLWTTYLFKLVILSFFAIGVKKNILRLTNPPSAHVAAMSDMQHETSLKHLEYFLETSLKHL